MYYFLEKKGISLLVITGYRPGKRNKATGVKTAWSQQQTMLAKDGQSELPHEAFFIDMTQWLESYKTPGMEILFWLDANERWTEQSSIAKFTRSLNLVNINNEAGLPATHLHIAMSARSTTIDFGSCSRTVLDNITYVSAVPYDLDMLGNHRGVVLDIQMDRLLSIDKVEDDISSRKLVLLDQKAVKRYLDIVKEGFDKQNICKRVDLTVMFAALSSVCMGFALMCVNQIKRVITVGTGYVDDVTLGLSIPREQAQTEKMVQKHIQRMGQLWEKYFT